MEGDLCDIRLHLSLSASGNLKQFRESPQGAEASCVTRGKVLSCMEQVLLRDQEMGQAYRMAQWEMDWIKYLVCVGSSAEIRAPATG